MCEFERTNDATPAAGIDRYTQYEPVDLPDRQWPTRTMTAPPRWCSVDLRDGNQALVNPMDLDRKHALFQLLVDMGYREIEVAFPAASQTEFDFVRQLVERDLIPDDVTIQVITPARPELIARTFESIRGADRAIVHLYNSTSTVQRDVVFRKNRAEITALAADGTRLCRKHAEENPATEVQFEYTPESFTGTELDFALEICDEVSEVWEPTSELPIIVNLPATVEMSTPNVYADRIEWMGRSLRHRANTVISVHPHNDRGTGVAAAELAVLAGAQRVEGCLFGNGERTGNVCLVTLGLNLYTQGIDPHIDFSDIDAIRRTVERCNELPVHPRHPYGGELVYTSFSGSHQDAIKKGLDEMRSTAGPRPWAVPYLPIDPKDVGRTYQAVIRVNSQSGKGGVAYLLEAEHELDLPRELQVDFSHLVQKHTDQRRTEVAADEIWTMFESEYVHSTGPLASSAATAGSICAEHGERCVVLEADGRRTCLEAGDETLPAGLLPALKRLGLGDVDLRRCVDHPIGPEGARRVAAYCEIGLGDRTTWGVGIDGSRAVALLDAATSAVNRALSAAVPIG